MTKAKIDLRWIPVANRRFYCSPACGANCTRGAYNRAVKRSAQVAKELGNGWKPEVWENLGWHWKVVKGDMIEIREYRGPRVTYHLRVSSYFTIRLDRPIFRTPKAAARAAKNAILATIGYLEKQL